MPSAAGSTWSLRGRSVISWLRRRDVLVRDGLLAAGLAAAASVPTLAAIGVEIGDLPVRAVDPVAVLVVLAQTVPLAVRRRSPAACLAVVGSAFAVHEVLAYPTTFAGIGLYLALYSAGAHQNRFRAAAAATASAAYAGLAVVLHGLGSPQGPPDFAVFYSVLVLCWAAGSTVRGWRAQEARHRSLTAEVATAAERARITRELHDVVTHHVVAMVVQADAAQVLVPDAPERVTTALATIGGTGRSALSELRSVLDVLGATGDPPPAGVPALGTLRELADRARLTGQPVEFDERGRNRTVPVDVQQAAHRVVQESLTNAMKHAAGRRTVVRVAYGDDDVEIEVTTDGPPTAVPGVGSGERGLAGLRARVGLLDGSLDAGPRPGGGFGVRARIPRGGRA